MVVNQTGKAYHFLYAKLTENFLRVFVLIVEYLGFYSTVFHRTKAILLGI